MGFRTSGWALDVDEVVRDKGTGVQEANCWSCRSEGALQVATLIDLIDQEPATGVEGQTGGTIVYGRQVEK